MSAPFDEVVNRVVLIDCIIVGLGPVAPRCPGTKATRAVIGAKQLSHVGHR